MSALSFPAPLVPAVAEPVRRVQDAKAMSFFRRSTVQHRLTIAFLAMGALSLLNLGAAIWQLRAMERQHLDDLRTVRIAGELHAAAASEAARLHPGAGLPTAQAPAAPADAAPDARLQSLQEQLAARGGGGDAAQALLREADTARTRWQSALREHPAEAPPAAQAYVAATRAILDDQAGEGTAAARLEGRADRASLEVLALFVLLSMVALPIVVVLLTHVLRPMHGAVRIARRVADGDLTVKVRTGGNDEMARLMYALDDMTESLRRIVGEVARSAGAVAEAGEQVRQGQSDLSQRTETQASTLEQTASSMEELTATVSQNAETARQASQLAAGAAEVAFKGGEVVGQVVRSMGGISASARRISDISSVIDGIAFQTNILALNAAVEAARAGEQGRGFAVVAAEVRNLAQRSAQAAREIKGLISESVQQVDSGAQLVDTAGRTMEDIVGSVRRVSDLIAEIAAASDQQRSGIEQVNAAIGQMDRVVQKNAALVEQTSQSTESLHRHASALLETVAQFRLHEDGAPAQPRPALRGSA